MNKKIYYVEVGDLTKKEAASMLERIKNRFAETDEQGKVIEELTDVFVPIRKLKDGVFTAV